jgi:hypothetical protein
MPSRRARHVSADRASGLEIPGPVRLIDPKFDDAVDFLGSLPSGSSRLEQIFFLSMHPRQTLEVARLAKALPWVCLPVHRIMRNRNSPEETQSRARKLAVAVLDLRANCNQYLAGPGRQAVRTNSSRAVRFGAKTVELASATERFEAFHEILRAREPEKDTSWPWLDLLTKSGTNRCFGGLRYLHHLLG